MTGWLPPMAVLKDRFEQLTSRATGFGGGHWIGMSNFGHCDLFVHRLRGFPPRRD
jgi:hypothetical protein